MADDDPEVELAETFAEVARALLGLGDEEATLDRICELLVETLETSEAAGISIVRRGRVENRAANNGIPGRVDEIQTETQEGPCIDAIKDHEVFVTGDLAVEERWPQFSRVAHEETGVTSIVCVRLYADEETMGSLNIYSRAKEAFDDHDIAVGAVFATHAAVAMHGARRQANLEAKAETRDIIGMAKGLLMSRGGVSPEQAFQLLRQASQRMNVKLRDVAQGVVDDRSGGATRTDGSKT